MKLSLKNNTICKIAMSMTLMFTASLAHASCYDVIRQQREDADPARNGFIPTWTGISVGVLAVIVSPSSPVVIAGAISSVGGVAAGTASYVSDTQKTAALDDIIKLIEDARAGDGLTLRTLIDDLQITANRPAEATAQAILKLDSEGRLCHENKGLTFAEVGQLIKFAAEKNN